MTDYKIKSYGRYDVVAAIFQRFLSGLNLSMPGPRRLGKSFVLERIAQWASEFGYRAISFDVSGLANEAAFYRYLCEIIKLQLSATTKTGQLIAQRFTQLIDPRKELGGSWYSPFLNHDHQAHLERQLASIATDSVKKWVLLIDELPIFLKALHDQGPAGVAQARNLMNHLAQLQAKHPSIRWLVTGSIGFGPLAKQGNYESLLTKYTHFQLEPLSQAQAIDYLQDIASQGELPARSAISTPECKAIIRELGWLSAYYLRAIATHLEGQPTDTENAANAAVEQAVQRLLKPMDGHPFSVWEENLRKHYSNEDRLVVIPLLNRLASHGQANASTLLALVDMPALGHAKLMQCLYRLHTEGYIACSDWQDASDGASFTYMNPLLRRYWRQYPLSLSA